MDLAEDMFGERHVRGCRWTAMHRNNNSNWRVLTGYYTYLHTPLCRICLHPKDVPSLHTSFCSDESVSTIIVSTADTCTFFATCSTLPFSFYLWFGSPFFNGMSGTLMNLSLFNEILTNKLFNEIQQLFYPSLSIM